MSRSKIFQLEIIHQGDFLYFRTRIQTYVREIDVCADSSHRGILKVYSEGASYCNFLDPSDVVLSIRETLLQGGAPELRPSPRSSYPLSRRRRALLWSRTIMSRAMIFSLLLIVLKERFSCWAKRCALLLARSVANWKLLVPWGRAPGIVQCPITKALKISTQILLV